MPKRRMKEEKPKKRVSKTQILIPPIAIGAATLAGLLIMQLIPPPPVLNICLKAHNVDTFNVHPTVEVVVDGRSKLLPDDIGKQPKDGKECLRVIHTDEIGNKLHIQYVRPVRLTMDDFLKVYSTDNKTISVFDNTTGVPTKQIINLGDYNPKYSYYSEKGEFTSVANATAMPPFTDNMVVRYELIPK
jgi:DNA-binding beta-propeller fold protein YncE